MPALSHNILKNTVDYVSFVNEVEIFKAINYLFNKFNIVSEGAGALPTAVFINNKNFFKSFDYIFIPICGKNIEKKEFNKIIL